MSNVMSRCHACGQERGESLSAHLASLGWDGLVHCSFIAIYAGKVKPCVSAHRQCELCPVSRQYGEWKPGRTGPVFEPKETK